MTIPRRSAGPTPREPHHGTVLTASVILLTSGGIGAVATLPAQADDHETPSAPPAATVAAEPGPVCGTVTVAVTGDLGATKFMCEHCTNPGEYHVHTDRPHWLCEACLDTLAAHHELADRGMMCEFDGCEKPAYRSSKLCTGHRSQKQRGQELRPLAHRPPVEGDCRFVGCDRPARTRQLCAGHYNQLIRGSELRPLNAPRAKPARQQWCDFPGCEKPHYSRGLCTGHASQRRRGQDLRPLGRNPDPKPAAKRSRPSGPKQPCSFDGCDRPQEAHGLCAGHCKQKRRGTVLKPLVTRATRRPAPAIDEGPRWVPGTLWPDLEQAEIRRPSTVSENVASATLLYTSTVIPDETAAACRAVLESWDAADLADMLLGVAS